MSCNMPTDLLPDWLGDDFECLGDCLGMCEGCDWWVDDGEVTAEVIETSGIDSIFPDKI